MLAVMIATLVQSLDSTVANVALPYMQGSLSASYDQITWVLTSYVVAAAIMTAPVGWLAARFGRKNVLVFCLIGFTTASMLCGVATSLNQMVLDRLLQGSFGAALVPLSQSVMMDIYTPEERPAAMSIWAMGVVLGPILGPTLGGFLTFYYNWHFVFFVNLPFGIVGALFLIVFMPGDPAERDLRFDWTGFGLLSLGLAALQIGLDRGEELDWLSSPVIVTMAILAVAGLYLFVVHMCTTKDPFISKALFADMNFVTTLISMLCIGVLMLATSALLPPYLENLMGNPVERAGILMAPRGLGSMLAMYIVGKITHRTDPRLVTLAGYIATATSILMMEGWTPDVPASYIMLCLLVQGFGMGAVFMPLQVVAFYNLPASLRSQGAGMINLVRNVGSAIGVSLTSALLDHQSQYEHAVLTQYVTPFTRPLQGAAMRVMNPQMPGGAALMNSVINTQAQIIAYVDDYKFLLLVCVPAALCLLLVSKPPAVKVQIAAEAAE